MDKIVFKAVHVRGNGERVSAFIGASDSNLKLALRYKEGVETMPKVGKIFAFDTFEAARGWHWGDQVWEAQGKDVTRLLRMKIFCNMIDIKDNLHHFWQRKVKGDDTAPAGTVLCLSLTLIRRLK